MVDKNISKHDIYFALFLYNKDTSALIQLLEKLNIIDY